MAHNKSTHFQKPKLSMIKCDHQMDGWLLPTRRNNNSQNYPAQLCIRHQSHHTNSRNNLYVPGQGLTYLKLAYPSLEHPSGTPCLKI